MRKALFLLLLTGLLILPLRADPPNILLIIFSSDNGPEDIAYARIQNHGHFSSGPLRGVKRDIWEGGHRVPFVVRYSDCWIELELTPVLKSIWSPI